MWLPYTGKVVVVVSDPVDDIEHDESSVVRLYVEGSMVRGVKCAQWFKMRRAQHDVRVWSLRVMMVLLCCCCRRTQPTPTRRCR